MKMKQRSKKAAAWGLSAAMCLSMLITSGQPAVIKAEETDSNEIAVTLSNPVIEAEKGHVVWDCIYFGNYWQKKYITRPGNMPEKGEDDVAHTDTDGTEYIVRADKSCYKREPIKWRVLSVSEDGTDAFVMADQCLDAKAFQSGDGKTGTTDTVAWENSDIREWLNGTFMKAAFSAEEQEAIKTTEIDNLRYFSYYEGSDIEISGEDGTPTQDRIYLPSLDDMLNKKYGFVNSYRSTDNTFSDSETRQAYSTDFAKDNADGYWLRTLAASKEKVLIVGGVWSGGIHVTGTAAVDNDIVGRGVRPVFHMDLTKTGLWEYAGKVTQDQTVIEPDATPAAPTERPTAQPGVTMAPGQTYPQNPIVDETDLDKNTWDCIYFGNYYNTKITPSELSLSEEDNTVETDEKGNKYLVRHEKGYFQYEPIKWRVLSINEDGTDAFVMADKVLDITKYYRDGSVEITWEKSDVRVWLNDTFMKTAFTEAETDAIKETTVTTAYNQWSGEAGGNDTQDKIYLPSIEEMLETAYGFSSDENEGSTRSFTATDFANAETQPDGLTYKTDVHWLRSQGAKAGYPARIGSFWGGDGGIDVLPQLNDAASIFGVRPVMHVDLSDTTLWTYAGQVTPNGVVVPNEEEPKETTEPEETTEPDETAQPTKNPVAPTAPATTTQNPAAPTVTAGPTQNPQQVGTEVKKPDKPVIKKLKNQKGKKVIVTLSKNAAGVTGYQVAYAAKASMKGQKQKLFKGTSVTIKGLKKKKTYYFRVRAYIKENGKAVYGNWSSKKSIKIKK